MRIAVLSPSWFPVPPTGYGGIEWVVSLLADGLVDAGHDVTLFASGDSRTKAKLAYVYASRTERVDRPLVRRAAPRPPCFERPVTSTSSTTTRGLFAGRSSGARDSGRAHGARAAVRRAGAISTTRCEDRAAVGLISLSMNQRKPRPGYNWIANVPNALDLSVYPFRRQRGDYLLFLGRMSPDKGAHRAIEVAMETGCR